MNIKSIKTIYLFCLTIVLFIAYGCGQNDKLLPKEYEAWVENPKNGLCVERKMNPLSFSIQYKPLEYIVIKEEKSNSIMQSKINSRSNVLKKMQYFGLRIKTAEGGDILAVNSPAEQEYLQRQNYLMNDFQNDIQLVDGKDTLACALFQAVGNYGLAPYIDFMMGFETKDSIPKHILNDKEVIVDDRVFGNGILKFIIKKEDINNTPEIK